MDYRWQRRDGVGESARRVPRAAREEATRAIRAAARRGAAETIGLGASNDAGSAVGKITAAAGILPKRWLFMEQRITILGCGSSGGVPRVGNIWGACDPSDARNRRLRCSIAVSCGSAAAPARLQPSTSASQAVQHNQHDDNQGGQSGQTQIIVDTSPDLRQQLLRAAIGRVDAVLFTHSHADHVHGIDDLRPVAQSMGHPIPAYADPETAAALRTRFGYAVSPQGGRGYPPFVSLQEVKAGKQLRIAGSGGEVVVQALQQQHGRIESLGYRFGSMAYSVDVNVLPPQTFARLQGVDVWLLDALRYQPHPSHANLATALNWIEEVRPTLAVLTNLHIDMDYAELQAKLPAGVIPAIDGMTITQNQADSGTIVVTSPNHLDGDQVQVIEP